MLKKKQPETEVQRKIKKRYEARGWFVVRIIQTNRNGWPDLQCHCGGQTVFIETKATGKTASPLQRYVHEQLRKKGFVVYTIDQI